MSNNYSTDEVMISLENIAKDLERKNKEININKDGEKHLSNQYMATLIYDKNSNDKSLIIRDNNSKNQSELDIKDEYNSFYIKNIEGKKIDLKSILDEQNYNKLHLAHKENEIESFILNKNELNNIGNKNVIENTKELDINNSLNEDPIYKVLNEDKELMEQSMLFYQQSKILDVLTKAREQLENVNYAIDQGIDSDETRLLQSNLNDDVKHLESRSHKINNSLANNNVLQKINNKLEKNNEQNNEQKSEPKKVSKRRSKSSELSL